jgi:transcriptional regulator with XRE-family HTH domain
MPQVGRPRAPVRGPELRRRQDRLRQALGRQILELRAESGVSQRALADAAGIDRAHVSRIERGLAAASLDVVAIVAALLGADVSVRLFPTVSARLRDHVQAPMVEAFIRRLHPRWAAIPEMPVPAARGVIDLALRLRREAFGVACEFHSQLRSIDLIQRRLAEKRLALASIDRFGPETSSLLIVRSTALNREVVCAHEGTLGASFPARSVDAVAALGGEAAWPGPALLWIRVEGETAELLERPPRGVPLGR